MAARRAPRIDKLVDAWDPVLRKAFLDSVYAMRNAAQVTHIERLLAEGKLEAAIRASGIDEAYFRAYDKAIGQAFEAGGAAAASGVPAIMTPDGFRAEFVFNVRNPAAEKWLQERSSKQITQIVDDQRIMVREHLVAGMEAGNNPRKVALDLVGRVGASGRREGGVIGLTSSQGAWVRNYAKELTENSSGALERALRDKRYDPALRKAIATDTPLSVETQEKMVMAYSNRALRYRAEAIARTEAMASLHAAQGSAMEQAIENGVKPDAITYVWRATHDNRTRDSHAVMDGQRVKEGEMFITGDGNELEYPGDPNGPPEEIINCRCWREIDIDFLDGLE